MTTNQTNITTTLMSGGVAGTAVDVALFPIDTIKTRLQSQVGFKSSGGFRGIYNGLAPAALASAPSGGVFFCAYEGTKMFVGSHISKTYDPVIHMSAACIGELSSCIIRVPTELIKQRRQVQQYNSAIKAVQAILNSEGVKGFFRGYLSTVSREIPFSLMQFPLWELMKKRWSESQGFYVHSWQSSVCGAMSGGVSAIITTPLDVAKTRIMLASEHDILAQGNIFTALHIVYKQHGISGLFRGVIPRTIWISVGGAIFLGVYEKAQSIIFPYSGHYL